MTAFMALFISAVSHATQPAAFAAWASSMEQFNTMRVALVLGYPLPGCKAWLHASATETKVTVDWASCGTAKYSWDGSHVHYHNPSNPSAGVVDRPRYDSMVSDLWTELRAGFDNSTVTEVDQDQAEIEGPRVEWSKVELPFAWASGYTIYVGVGQGSQQFSQVQAFKNGKRKFKAIATAVYMNPQIPASDLGPYADPGGPPMDPTWRGGVP